MAQGGDCGGGGEASDSQMTEGQGGRRLGKLGV